MTRRIGSTAFLWLFLSLCPLARENPLFLPIAQLNLSHQTVLAIQQDAEGLLWFGTGDGLNRYDGYEVLVFRHDPFDEATLSGNLVTVLHPGKGGRLWIGTDNGVSLFDPLSARFQRVAMPDFSGDKEVRTLLEGPGGFVWAALAETLWVIDPKGLAARRVQSGHSTDLKIRAMQAEEGVGVWLEPFDSGALLLRASVESLGAELVLEEAANAGPVVDRDGHSVWPAEIGFSPRLPDPVSSRSLAPHLNDDVGQTWFGTQDGLVVQTAALEVEKWSVTDQGGYLSNFVLSLFRDRDGAFWVGTYRGLFRYDRFSKPFQHFVTNSGQQNGGTTGSSAAVSALQVEDTESVWVGTFGQGLVRWDPVQQNVLEEHRRREGDPSSLCHDIIWSLLSDSSGRLWIGTPGGLCALDPARNHFRTYAIPTGVDRVELNIRSMTLDAEGTLWLATTTGLYQFDPRRLSGSKVLAPVALTQPLEAILYDPRGPLWIGTAESSLVRWDPGTSEPTSVDLTQGLGTGRGLGVWSLGLSGDSLWIGSGLGLTRYSTVEKELEHFGVREGLPGAVVYGLVEDLQGRLWLGTNQGLALLDEPQVRPAVFTNFGPEDGVLNREFNRRAVAADPAGRVFLGGLDGVTFFDSSRILRNTRPPGIVLTSIEVESEAGRRDVNPFQLQELTLDSDDHAVSIQFSALSFTSPSRNRYRYRMEGLDPDWVESGTQRRVRYAGIPPGDYTLRVQASNGEGVWNAEGRSLALTVLPPFWRTLWFQLLVVAVLIGAGALVYRYRVARLLEMERLRLRVAEDLHDDLGSNLSGVALLGEGLLRSGQLEDRQQQQVHRITASARQMVEDLRDIVWMVDPKQDTLEDLVARMRDVARDLLGNTRYTFEAPAVGSTQNLGMETRRQLFLIFKESVHNVSRHSSSQNVEISLTREGDSLLLEVTDDGQGFGSDGGTGHGLKSMRRRAARLGADLTIESLEGKGTRVVLRTRIA